MAGSFYPRDPRQLAREVAALLGAPAAPPTATALGVLAPHAGYVYSGAVAGATYARVAVPRRVLVLCPNHTGLGARVALWPDGAWETPLGRVPVDPDLTEALRACPLVEADRAAHIQEHALEVQLPFLQVLRPDLTVAALCIGAIPVDDAVALGHAVAVATSVHPALVVASSDMSHFIPADEARRLDFLALERLLALDARGLYQVVHRQRISMCGVVPATVMLAAARQAGAREAELVRYASSGDVTGDRRSVVAYAGALVR